MPRASPPTLAARGKRAAMSAALEEAASPPPAQRFEVRTQVLSRPTVRAFAARAAPDLIAMVLEQRARQGAA